MRIEETLRSSIEALITNKVRSFLTMLGVIIGVFAVVSLVSVGSGIEKFISDRFNEIGSNLIIVAPGTVGISSDPALAFTSNKLEAKHIDLLEEQLGDLIVAISPSIRLAETAEYKTEKQAITVLGGSYQLFDAFDLKIAKGREFTKSEEHSHEKVVLIGDKVQETLYSNSESIAKEVEIGGESFEVIGVLEPKNETFDEAVVVPYTSVKTYLDVDNFSSIGIKAKDQQNISRVMKKTELALLRDLDEDDFTVLSQADILKSITSILGVITTGVGAIAAISLLVGGIGIMNIMLVAVTERTNEIGLRKALGATPNIIASQFIAESVLLSLIGGLIGLLLSVILSIALKSVIELVITSWSVFLAIGFSVGVGVLFGTYPALKAANKDPIEALRYE